MSNSEIFFRVYFITNPLETIKIIGNHESLGNWNINKGLCLVTNQDNYPYWISEIPIIVPPGSILEYKCAVFANGELKRWENLPGNSNRDYKARCFRVLLEFREDDLIYRENVLKKSPSSKNAAKNLGKVKKSHKDFNPFSHAQESEVSDLPIKQKEIQFEKSDDSGVESFHARNSFEVLEDDGLTIHPKEDNKYDIPCIPIKTYIKDYKQINNKPAKTSSPKNQRENMDDILTWLYTENFAKKTLKCKGSLVVKHENEKDAIKAEELDDIQERTCSDDKIIYIAFKLPIKITYIQNENTNWKIESTDDSYLSTLYQFYKTNFKNMYWIGWIDEYIPMEKREILIKILYQEYNCIPLFLEEEISSSFLDEYCCKYLYEIFNNMNILKTSAYFNEYWKIYEEVNNAFANMILKNIDENTILIIHDYNLLLVPKLIAINNPKQLIIYNFVSYFPNYDTFKLIHEYELILKSILCSDLICFISSEYMIIFLEIINKIYNIDYTIKKSYIYIKYMGRNIFLKICNPSVNFNHNKYYFMNRLCDANKATNDNNYQNNNDDLMVWNKLNSTINRNDNNNNSITIIYFTLYKRIEYIENLLSAIKIISDIYKNKNFILKIYEIEEGYVTTKNSKTKLLYKQQLLDYINTINHDLKENNINSIIEIQNQLLTKDEKENILKTSDIIIILANYIELDRLALQYIYLNQINGVLILSEFNTLFQNLNSIIRINQYKQHNIREKLEQILYFDKDNQNYLLNCDKKLIMTQYNALNIFENILRDITKIKTIKYKMPIQTINNNDDFILIAASKRIEFLDINQVINSFKKAKNKVIFLSWEGALNLQDHKSKIPMPSSSFYKSKITIEDLEIIRSLTLQPNLEVYIISSKKFDNFSSTFDDIDNIGLLAEYGYQFKLRKESKIHNLFSCDWWWRTTALKIMQNYANRTDGISIDINDSTICWNYENSTNMLVKIQIKELINHLNLLLEHSDNLEIISESKSIEVKPASINKGIAVELILRKIQKQKNFPDFVLCIGGSSSDEEMYNRILNLKKNEGSNKNIEIFTVTTTKKPTLAQYYLNTGFDVYNLLSALTKN